MLKKGDKAPAFSLATQDGKASSAALKGQRYVLYFYPADDTPGCTKEACSFRDNLARFNTASVPVFGVSPQDAASKSKFAAKYKLNFPLLADVEKSLAEAYGVWVEKSMYGKKYMGVQRSTFVVNAKGVIEQVWEKVKPEDHAAEVLAYLAGGSTATMAAKPAAKRAAATGAGKTGVKKVAAKKPAVKKPVAKKSR
jgi:thioredoxin-dependent peroxiredoxin